jgi:hypothetical protein
MSLSETRRNLVGMLLLLGATAGPAHASAERSLERSVRLLSPAPHARLTAGTIAVIEWQAERHLLDPEFEIEEWEAFLSLDGGRSYSIRLTPHMDVAARQFFWRVPDLPTPAARLILRFGNERKEIEMASQGSFSIVAGSAAPEVRPGRQAFRRGESARPNERGVVAWVEGSRGGSGLHEVFAAEWPDAVRSASPAGWLYVPLLGPSPSLPQVRAAQVGAMAEPLSLTPPPREPHAPLRGSIRLLIHRFNE